jgi:transglutaminase-like putative cysteine protease
VSRRAALGVLVLALWLVAVGWQVRREYFQPELTRLAEALLTLDPGTHFYAIRMGERTIGTSSSRLDTIPEGFRIDDLTQLDLLAMGEEGQAVIRTSATMSPTLRLLDFTFSLQSGAGAFDAEGRVHGDSLLTVRIAAGGTEPEEVRFRLSEPPLVASMLPIRLAKGGELRVGRTIRFPVFDPSTVSNRVVEVQVMEEAPFVVTDSATVDPATGRWSPAGERSVPAWRIVERYGGVVVESWVDGDGRILRSTSPLGFSIQRTEFELARQARDDARGTPAGPDTDLVFATAIASNARLDAAGGYDRLRFRLTGVELEGFDLAGGRQALEGDILTVTRERWADLEPGYALPYPRMDLREALEPEPLVQSGDPRIRSAAEAMVRRGGRLPTDPKVVAERLNDGVYRLLRKEVVFSLPSALSVLESRRGDCTEHTVLYVALARSLGLPARTAVGLVYLDGAFFYHAWPEVWLGEWVAVDPTWGEAPAGAAHLRFATGTLARQVELARLIGTLGIEVVE